MKNLILFLCIFSAAAFAQTSNSDRLKSIKNIKRLAFASCNKQYSWQPLWKDLIFSSPDLFIWGGDNVYVNSPDTNKIKAAYDLQNKIDDYKFFKSRVPIIGTWDDHDYGDNDADGTYAGKVKSQQYILDFLEEPVLSPRRSQEGIYASYLFGDAGRQVKIILLDNRYFLNIEKDAPLLGEKQWKWLEDQLKNSPAAIHFIVSGLSILSPTNMGSEEWLDYSGEYKRLNRLIDTYSTKGIVFLTGDKHFSSIFTRDGRLEFLSSGMTHNTRLPLRPYVRARFPSPVFLYNYALIDIEWEDSLPLLTFSTRLADGNIVNVRQFKWEEKNWKQLPVKGVMAELTLRDPEAQR